MRLSISPFSFMTISRWQLFIFIPSPSTKHRDTNCSTTVCIRQVPSQLMFSDLRTVELCRDLEKHIIMWTVVFKIIYCSQVFLKTKNQYSNTIGNGNLTVGPRCLESKKRYSFTILLYVVMYKRTSIGTVL